MIGLLEEEPEEEIDIRQAPARIRQLATVGIARRKPARGLAKTTNENIQKYRSDPDKLQRDRIRNYINRLNKKPSTVPRPGTLERKG